MLQDEERLVAAFEAAMAASGKRLRLAVLDLILSFPPVIMPLQRLCKLFRCCLAWERLTAWDSLDHISKLAGVYHGVHADWHGGCCLTSSPVFAAQLQGTTAALQACAHKPACALHTTSCPGILACPSAY